MVTPESEGGLGRRPWTRRPGEQAVTGGQEERAQPGLGAPVPLAGKQTRPTTGTTGTRAAGARTVTAEADQPEPERPLPTPSRPQPEPRTCHSVLTLHSGFADTVRDVPPSNYGGPLQYDKDSTRRHQELVTDSQWNS
eukprot:159076-Rhodomonas_salina.1